MIRASTGPALKQRTLLATLASSVLAPAALAADAADPIEVRSAFQGKAPAGLNYWFILTYQDEEPRRKWIASDIHQKACRY